MRVCTATGDASPETTRSHRHRSSVGRQSFPSPLESESAMRRMIFVNLPVADLPTAAGLLHRARLRLNADFSDARGRSCIVVSDTIFVMLLTRDRFADFSAGPVGDPRTGTTDDQLPVARSAAARWTSWSPGRSRRGGIAVAGQDAGGPDVRPQLRRPRRSRLGGPAHGPRPADPCALREATAASVDSGSAGREPGVVGTERQQVGPLRRHQGRRLARHRARWRSRSGSARERHRPAPTAGWRGTCGCAAAPPGRRDHR